MVVCPDAVEDPAPNATNLPAAHLTWLPVVAAPPVLVLERTRLPDVEPIHDVPVMSVEKARGNAPPSPETTALPMATKRCLLEAKPYTLFMGLGTVTHVLGLGPVVELVAVVTASVL